MLLAEADVEAGSLAEATQLVNQIRTRAAQTAQGCGDASAATKFPSCVGHTELAVPINSPTITWATYRIGNYPTFADQATGRNAVRAERRIELAMEGQRLFDLRRWGQAYASSTINAFIGAEKTRRLWLVGAEPFAQKHMFYPIPQLQVELSKVGGTPKITQNPGW